MEEAFKLYAQILTSLNDATPEAVREAARLCLQLPAPTAETRAHIEQALISTGFALEQMGEYERASGFYRMLMNSDSADPGHRSNASLRYGLLCEQGGNYRDSVTAFQRALDFTSTPLIARIARKQLAVRLLRDGRHREAIAHLEQLLADPELEEAARLPCRLRLMAGMVGTGRYDPEHPAPGEILPAPGTLIDDATLGAWTEGARELESAYPAVAREFYERLLDMQGVPERIRIDAHFRAGLMCEAVTDWDCSFQHYRMAVGAPSGHFPEAQTQARFHLAELLYFSEEYEPALEHLAILRTAPEANAHQQMQAHLRYATCLLRLKRFDEAQQEFESCRDRAGANGSFVLKSELGLAELFEQLGRFSEARECYQRIIQNPSSEPLTKTAAFARLEQLRR